MKKWLEPLCLIFIIIFSPAVFSQTQEVAVNADKITYTKDKYQLEAEGSVEVIYRDLFARGNHLLYNTSAEVIWLDQGFSLNHLGVKVAGQQLNYQIKEGVGRANNVNFEYQGIELSGQALELSRSGLHLKNAGFTTCNLSRPHYKVTASDIDLNPEYGWLVAYWGYFWLNGIPVVPMPTYIYDLQAETKSRRNIPPFPEIGSNYDDGTYISEKLPWHLRRELSGSYTLSYAANKGLGAGLEADYILNSQNTGDARIYGNHVNGLFGGLTHKYAFGSEFEAPSNDLAKFFVLPRYRQYELSTTASYHERINYQRVSFYPDISLKSRSSELFRKEARYDFELKAGLVAEMGNTKLARGGGNFTLYGDFQKTSLGFFSPYLTLDYLYYSNNTRWVRDAVGCLLTQSWHPSFSTSLGYSHYFFLDGISPFAFETYRYRGIDRLKPGAFFLIGETGVKIDASYYLDNWTPEDVDYALFFKLHCYNLSINYRAMRGELTLGFTLAAK